MAKINCKATNCINNRYDSCMKVSINVLNKTKENAICESYKEKKFNDYKSEFAYMEFPMLFEVSVDCQSKDCYYNKNLKCGYSEIEIKPVFDEEDLSISCLTYKKKND